jgi:hypothetical protein
VDRVVRTPQRTDVSRDTAQYINPEIPWVGVTISFDHHKTKRFAAYIAEWARQDPTLEERLLSLSASSLMQTQKTLLAAIYREIGG